VTRLLQQPPDERLANLERLARCTVTRFRRRKATQEEMDLKRLMPSFLARSEDVWEYTACAICLADFADGEELRRAPCSGGHAFHPKCLRGWLERSHATCPVCRGDVEQEDDGGRAVPRPSGRPGYDGLAEYVVRRMRSGKVDFTISAANHKRAARVMRLLQDPPGRLREPTPEPEEPTSSRQEARAPDAALPERVMKRMEAKKAARKTKSLCLTLPT